MINFEKKGLKMVGINVDPEILGGTPVFAGTRVPVKTLFDYLSGGISNLQDFLEDYPSVNPDDAKRIVESLGEQLLKNHLIEA